MFINPILRRGMSPIITERQSIVHGVTPLFVFVVTNNTREIEGKKGKQNKNVGFVFSGLRFSADGMVWNQPSHLLVWSPQQRTHKKKYVNSGVKYQPERQLNPQNLSNLSRIATSACLQDVLCTILASSKFLLFLFILLLLLLLVSLSVASIIDAITFVGNYLE